MCVRLITVTRVKIANDWEQPKGLSEGGCLTKLYVTCGYMTGQYTALKRNGDDFHILLGLTLGHTAK